MELQYVFYVNHEKVAAIGRPRHLPDTLLDFDFAALARTEKHARTRIRFLGMEHLNEGYLYREVAQFLGVHLTTVQDWVHRFSAEGLDGLRESPRSGATRKLSANREEAFKAAVMALGEQREGGRITGHTIRTLLAEQFGVHCCLNSVYNLLHRLGLVWITARSKHPKQDQAVQDAFKKTLSQKS
jgi:transposase